jgi:hypothetical protein
VPFKFFFIVFLLYTVLFAIVESYLYYRKIFPALRKHNPHIVISLTPLRARKLPKQYLAMLDSASERPRFYALVRYNKYLEVIHLILFVTVIILGVVGRTRY